jgi:hypothetical protein
VTIVDIVSIVQGYLSKESVFAFSHDPELNLISGITIEIGTLYFSLFFIIPPLLGLNSKNHRSLPLLVTRGGALIAIGGRAPRMTPHPGLPAAPKLLR